MYLNLTSPLFTRLSYAACALVIVSAPSRAQTLFSLDRHGPTKGAIACQGTNSISAGDVLAPCTPDGMPALGPLQVPQISIAHFDLGIAFCPCDNELDALSCGTDGVLREGKSYPPGKVNYSVDEFASGWGLVQSIPSVSSEGGLVGDGAADVFTMKYGTGFKPWPFDDIPIALNAGIIDGDGQVSATAQVYPGLGLVEPTAPIIGPLNDPGDDLDALDLEGPDAGSFPATGVYFSLEGATFDPQKAILGSGTAQIHGVQGGDVLLAAAQAAAFVVYAPSQQIGLDLLGLGSDDLDALALHENGMPGFQASLQPFDWEGVGGTDMLLFSVRRGSAVVGMPDSLYGLPIKEGDILTTPLAPQFGALSPFPAILLPAEMLGLSTDRTASPTIDDLDALDISLADPLAGIADDPMRISAPNRDGRPARRPLVPRVSNTY